MKLVHLFKGIVVFLYILFLFKVILMCIKDNTGMGNEKALLPHCIFDVNHPFPWHTRVDYSPVPSVISLDFCGDLQTYTFSETYEHSISENACYHFLKVNLPLATDHIP